MKTIAFCSILLFAACASPTAVIRNTFDCAPGQDLEVRAGLGDPTRTGEQTGQYVFLVEVANNSHGDLTVTSVRVDPRDSQQRIRRDTPIQGASKEVDETIEAGTEHLFELPATAFGAFPSRDVVDQVLPGPIEFVVTISLTNGDSYRCPFAVERR